MHTGYDYTQFAVLFVDDEDKALKYFKKAFSKDLRIITAFSVSEALSILHQRAEQIGVLITDQRMPGENGIELLKQARKKYPNIVRMLTTAYSDLSEAIEAVNQGEIFRYITKPWDLQILRSELLSAMEFFLVQQERDQLLKEKLGVWQRLVQTDYVRELLVMAGSLSQIRFPIQAINAFLEQIPMARQTEQNDRQSRHFDLWKFVQTHTRRMLEVAQDVIKATGTQEANRAEHKDLQLTTLFEDMQNTTDARDKDISIQLEFTQELPPIRANTTLIKRLFEVLLLLMVDMSTPGALIRITAETRDISENTPGIRINIIGEPAPWKIDGAPTLAQSQNEPLSIWQANLLTAFFICYHHAGRLHIEQFRREGTRFEILLPQDPLNATAPMLDDDWMEKTFQRYENLND